MADGSFPTPDMLSAPPAASEARQGGSLTSRAMSARRALEAAVEHALALLDEIEGDTDLEEEPDREEGGDAEPSLGWPNAFSAYPSRGLDDLEDEHDGREPGEDDEPDHDGENSLGWSEGQSLRGDVDGRAYMDEAEPLLGATENANQTRWATHAPNPGRWGNLYQDAALDAEEQCEDEGGACEDEGAQCDDEGAIEYEVVGSYGEDQTRPIAFGVL